MLHGVQRLAGSDAGFLFIESPEQTSVCVDVALLTPPGDGAPPLTLLDLRRRVAERLPLLPAWRWRLAEVPLGLHHPVWIDDPDFDLDYHLRQVTLPEPGDDALDELLAEIEPQLLDLRHPLWQLILVHGLGDGRQALIFRFHHTIADGAALLLTLDLLLDPEHPALPDDRPAGPPPTKGQLARAALRDLGRQWREIPSMVGTTRERFAAVEQRRSGDVPEVPRSMNDAPGTRLNRPGPPVRTYARTRLATAELQGVRRTTGATLNDVVLGVVAGALRSYLDDLGELPDRPLVANVPVAGAPSDEPQQTYGNRFSNFFTSLATDVADPIERLAAISAGTAEAKAQLDLQGRDTLPSWLDRLPPAIARPASRWLARRTLADPTTANFNVLVSNVRVPDPSWDLGGHGVEHLWMSGPIADDAGLNITVVGFGDHLHLSVVASPVAVPDAADLTARCRAALEELVACTV